MRAVASCVVCAIVLAFAGAVRADEAPRARARILPLTRQVMDAAESIRSRQVALSTSFKNVIKEATGEPENPFIRFEHECSALHARARNLNTNTLLERVGLQKTRLEKQIAFLEAFDRVDASTPGIGRELDRAGTSLDARGTFRLSLRPALSAVRELLPQLAAYRGYREQRRSLGARSTR